MKFETHETEIWIKFRNPRAGSARRRCWKREEPLTGAGALSPGGGPRVLSPQRPETVRCHDGRRFGGRVRQGEPILKKNGHGGASARRPLRCTRHTRSACSPRRNPHALRRSRKFRCAEAQQHEKKEREKKREKCAAKFTSLRAFHHESLQVITSRLVRRDSIHPRHFGPLPPCPRAQLHMSRMQTCDCGIRFPPDPARLPRQRGG